MLAILMFLAVLSVLVLIHELGHFLAARIFGVKAEEFGYGFPPRLLGFVKDQGKWKRVSGKDENVYPNTIWSINWLPLGGFVRIKGEGTDDKYQDTDSFQHKPIWKRSVILAAGVAMNWLLAYLIFITIFLAGAPSVLEDVPPGATIQDRSIRITNVMAGLPADKAALQAGDQIVSVAGIVPTTYEDARELISKQGLMPFDIKYLRDGDEKTATLNPMEIKELGRPGIGVALADVGIVRFRVDQAFWYAGVATYAYTKDVVTAFGTMLRDIVLLRGVQQDVSGPVGIAVMTGQVAKQGIVPLLQFAAILSINLAVVNFLPIPALDGGRVFFLVIEKIRRKPVGRKLEAGIHQAAFIALIILILLITLRDLGRYGGTILGGIKGLVGI